MYKLNEIAQMMNAVSEGDTSRSGEWQFLIDSRNVVQPEHSVFFALHTKHNDGHNYITELISKGVTVFIVSYDYIITDNQNITYLKVTDTLKALQLLALNHRKKFQMPVLGITGSNGKTIVKEWLNNLLGGTFNICASPKSYNSQIGVPISVLDLNEQHNLGIFEAGISLPGEMQALEAIIQPTIGVLTHIGSAHDEGFSNAEEKIDEKLLLFSNVKILLLKYDAAIIKKIKVPVAAFGFNEKSADLNITDVKSENSNTYLKGIYKGKITAIQIPFADEASIENACLCWLISLYLECFDGSNFEKLTPVSMRLELKHAINNCLLINDSYSNDLNALTAAFSFLKRQSVHQKTTVILSDIEQSGLTNDRLCKEVNRILIDKNVNKLIAIGPVFFSNQSFFNGDYKVVFCNSTEEFLNAFDGSLFENETILLKGARSFRFEKIALKFEKQTHGTVLEIDLSSIQQNLNFIKGKLPVDIKIMAMVKAFAYGSGSYEIAKLLEKKVDYLAVAYADEGETLRHNGLKTPIMVMNADEDTFSQCIKYNLEPVIYSFNQLKSLLFSIHQQPLNIHLEFDTGMHRLGFAKTDVQEIVKIIKANKNLHVQSVFSHLSASDESAFDEFTQQQFLSYSEISLSIEQLLGYSLLKHISNTAAALRFNQNGFNMVRIGIGLYGIDPSGVYQKMISTVFTLKTTISQIKLIAPNESIGYGRKGIENRERKIAVLAIGYADGLNRLLSNGKGSFLINGAMAPILGNVCMDMCMVDVTFIKCNEGDEAILFGKEKSIIDLSNQLNTIPYEILTSISQRVKRVYISE